MVKKNNLGKHKQNNEQTKISIFDILKETIDRTEGLQEEKVRRQTYRQVDCRQIGGRYHERQQKNRKIERHNKETYFEKKVQ